MKTNFKIIVIVITALGLGILLGYLIFGSQKGKSQDLEIKSHDTTSDMTGDQIWTCSMHPQIRLNEPGLCPICEMDLIPLESNASSDPLVLQMTKESAKLANIQTTKIGDLQSNEGKTIFLNGKVQADERLASSQVSHISGRIEKLFVTFTGEQVIEGQKIANLYSPDLITAQRELLEAEKLKDVNPGLFEATKNKLRFWKLGDTFVQSVLENGQIQETFTLYADATGVVTNRRVSVGDYINKGSVLFDLMNLRKVWVVFDAYEEDLASISLNDWIEFTTPSVPNKTYRSRITFIDPVINPQTRVALLRTEVQNSNKKLKPEMFVRGKLQQASKVKSALTVPKTAVLWTGDRSVVYVKLPEMEIPSYQYREITLGESLGNSYLVLEGLETGEEVVTNGSFTIDAAAQLNNQASMMNRNVVLKSKETLKTPDFRDTTPESFQQQLASLADKYIEVKNALVATDPVLASDHVKAFVAELNNVDMSLVKAGAHMYWMDQLNALKSHGNKIVNETDVEIQRKQFGFLSTAMINVLDAFGTSGNHIYVQFCPMAFDNKGADWLAVEKEIQNPYFGDKMMKCGIVKRDLSEDRLNESPETTEKSRNEHEGHNH